MQCYLLDRFRQSSGKLGAR
ncbi:hypothetical protein [Congregibacter brevis]